MAHVAERSRRNVSRSYERRKRQMIRLCVFLLSSSFFFGFCLAAVLHMLQAPVEPPKDVLTQVQGQTIEFLQNQETTLNPLDFVTNLLPEEAVTVEFFSSPPSLEILGEKVFPLLLTDDEGTQHVVYGRIQVRRLHPEPIIEGVSDIEVYIGDTIAYRSGVTATDLYGKSLDLQIENSQVDVSKQGVYPVVYTVEDDYGQSFSVETTVTVDENTQLIVETYMDEVFDTILTTGMTDLEKATAIFRWCRNNVRYAASGPNDDPYVLAYAAFRGQPGDCYTFFSVSYLLLQYAGIDVLPMERIAGTGVNHVWTIVNTGNGWYHFDTCPTFTGDEIFMYSESQARDLNVRTDAVVGSPQYYLDYKELPEGIEIKEN